MSDSRIERLEKLLKINTFINSSLDVDAVLGEILGYAAEVVEAAAASIMLLDELTGDLLCQQAIGSVGHRVCREYRIPKGEGVAGWVTEHQQALRIDDVYKDFRFSSAMDLKTGFRTQSMLCIPLVAKDRQIGVAQVINKQRRTAGKAEVVPFDSEDEYLFTLFGQQAALAIDNAQMHKALLKQERLKYDLKVAREIQLSLLPQESPEIPGLEIAGYYEPALQVGGDIYDYFLIDPNRLALIIGDVSGKGVSAAFYMARLVSELKALAQQAANPVQIVETLNRLQCERSRRGMFITFIFGIVDLRSFQLDYVRGGHPPLCRYSVGGEGEMIEQLNDRPLGILKDSTYRVNRLTLEPGDVLIGYTDGIVEAFDTDGRMIGAHWLHRYFKDLTPSAEALARSLADEVHRFGGQENFLDDIAMVVLKRKA